LRDAFVRRLLRHAEEDPRILLVSGDLGFGVFNEYRQRVPAQFLNAGIAEQNMTGMATGLALEGRIVFTYSIGNFPTLRCLEQIRNDACYHDANVKIVAIGGGFSYGALGISHHATEDLAILRALPNLTVVAPGDTWEAEEATSAIIETPGTAYLRLDRSTAHCPVAEGERFVLGQIRRLREGADLTLVSTGGILSVALEAAESLAAEGIDCRVLQVHTLKPIDPEPLFQACRETSGMITIEEHTIHGGLGGLTAELCLEAGVTPRRFQRLGLRAGFSAVVGSQDYLRSIYGIDAPSIAQAAREMLRRPPAWP